LIQESPGQHSATGAILVSVVPQSVYGAMTICHRPRPPDSATVSAHAIDVFAFDLAMRRSSTSRPRRPSRTGRISAGEGTGRPAPSLVQNCVLLVYCSISLIRVQGSRCQIRLTGLRPNLSHPVPYEPAGQTQYGQDDRDIERSGDRPDVIVIRPQ